MVERVGLQQSNDRRLLPAKERPIEIGQLKKEERNQPVDILNAMPEHHTALYRLPLFSNYGDKRKFITLLFKIFIQFC